MKSKLVCFTAIFAFVCSISSASAAVDCKKPPHHISFHLCCQQPDFTNDEILKQCAQFAGPPPPLPPIIKDTNRPTSPGSGSRMPPHRHPHGMDTPPPCLAECIFNKTELIDDSAELNQEKFDELVDKAVPDNEDLAEVVKASFTTCTEKINGFKDKITEKLKEHREYSKNPATRVLNPICSPIAGMIWACSNMETFRNCPASAWNNSEECNTARDFFKECTGNRFDY